MSAPGHEGGGCGWGDEWTPDELNGALDTYGAPPGDTVHDRLQAWEQRERALRVAAEAVLKNAGIVLSEPPHTGSVSVSQARLCAVRDALREPTDA